MPEITYKITEEVGVISENSRGWTKELNLVSWNDRSPKYDIREYPRLQRPRKRSSFAVAMILLPRNPREVNPPGLQRYRRKAPAAAFRIR